jgi:hypothetical protein
MQIAERDIALFEVMFLGTISDSCDVPLASQPIKHFFAYQSITSLVPLIKLNHYPSLLIISSSLKL